MADGNGFDKKNDEDWKTAIEKEKAEKSVAEPTPPQLPVLTIAMQKDGSFQVSGPIYNKPLALYMLEVAKDTIKAARPQPPQSHRPYYKGVIK